MKVFLTFAMYYSIIDCRMLSYNFQVNGSQCRLYDRRVIWKDATLLHFQVLGFGQRLSAFERFYHFQTNYTCPKDLLAQSRRRGYVLDPN